MFLSSLDSTLQIAFLYAIPAFAVIFSFRILGFADLTPDGSYTLGAAISGVLLINGFSNIVALFAAFFAGASAGVFTAILHNKIGVSKLLSGILVMLMLYSISLRIMGTSNLSLMRVDTFLGSLPSLKGSFIPFLSTAILSFGTYFILFSLLRTRIGLCLRAVGDSPTAMEYRGFRRGPFYIFGLSISNGIAACAGAIISQYQGFVDVSMGNGLVILSLAAVVMGETLLRPTKIYSLLLAVPIGMCLYQVIIAIVLRLGLAPTDMKIVTAILALVFISIDKIKINRSRTSRIIGNHNV